MAFQRPVKVSLQVLARRQVLKAGLGVMGVAAIPGCSILTGPSLPPGEDGIVGALEIPPISTNDDFYVVHYRAPVPVDRDLWNLFVYDEDEFVGGLAAADLDAYPLQQREQTLQCIESRPAALYMDNAIWGGGPLLELLAEAGIAPPKSAEWVRFLGADLFTTRLKVADLADAWLVWEMNGQALPLDHGAPLRLLVPGKFGWLNCKQLISMDFRAERPELGWEAEMQGAGSTQMNTELDSEDIDVQALAAFPTGVDLVDGDRQIRLLGKAFAGSDPIEWVGLSADEGLTWLDAELTYAPGPDRWTLWRFVWTPPSTGTFDFIVGARSVGGRTTTIGSDPDFIPYTGGMVLRLTVV